MGKWGVWCSVSGGVTGHREAWLKANGQRAEFETHDAADTEAARLRNADSMHNRGGVTITYTAKEITE